MIKEDPLRAEAGFSLLETLIVLAIVGALAGAAVLSFGGGGTAFTTRAEALRLADRLSLAADEALISGQAIALDVDAEGYAFLVQSDDASWTPHPSGLLGARRAAAPGVAFGVDSEQRLLIAPAAPVSANGGMTAITVGDADATWIVAFDGLSARAIPAGQE